MRWRREGSIEEGLLGVFKRLPHMPPVCVETGTCRGDRTAMFSDFFDKVYTIEISPGLHELAKSRNEELTNIEWLLGDSAQLLGPLAKSIADPVFFYLDAHWAGSFDGHAVADNPFPLWDELAVIRDRENPKDIVLVDDANIFGKDRPTYPEGHKWLDVSPAKIGAVLGPQWVDSRIISRDFVITQEPLKE